MNNTNTKYKCASLGKVKKLAYIVTLDNMLKSYDGLKKQDEEAIAKSGSSVSILTDAIIEKLTNLVNSERTLTCRNVLIANYDTMTNPQYWLNRKLFADLPKADSDALQKKIRQMVDLMAELAMKIFQLGESHSDAFFKKLMKSYEACQKTPYDIWKSRQLVARQGVVGQLHRRSCQTQTLLLLGGQQVHDRLPLGQAIPVSHLRQTDQRPAHRLILL